MEINFVVCLSVCPTIFDNTVCRIFMKFCVAYFFNLWGKREFRTNQLSDSYTLLKGENEFLNASSIFLDIFGVKYSVRNIRPMLSRNCKFRENGCRRGQAFLPDIHAITPIGVLRNSMEY
jgi:hypothetical protein